MKWNFIKRWVWSYELRIITYSTYIQTILIKYECFLNQQQQRLTWPRFLVIIVCSSSILVDFDDFFCVWVISSNVSHESNYCARVYQIADKFNPNTLFEILLELCGLYWSALLYNLCIHCPFSKSFKQTHFLLNAWELKVIYMLLLVAVWFTRIAKVFVSHFNILFLLPIIAGSASSIKTITRRSLCYKQEFVEGAARRKYGMPFLKWL